MKKTKREEFEILLEEASEREEVFRRFDPRKERFSGSQRHNLICAYNAFQRATKKLKKAEMGLNE